jgi:GWxTD domain-containing protein
MLLLASPLRAQEAKDRPLLDSLFATMAQATAAKDLPDVGRCSATTGSLARLCEGLLLTRRAELAAQVGDANRAEGLLRRTVEEKPDWAVAWYGLGVARFELARLKVLAREGPRQVAGLSWVAGGTAALVRALELDPTLLGAGEALARAPMPREGASRVAERLAILKRLRGSLGLTPSSRLALGRLEREAGNPDTATMLLGEAMAAGADSGVTMLEMARALHQAGRPVEGRGLLFAGAERTTTAESKRRYREELSWVATPQEMASWDSTPAPQRTGWLENFWGDRDVREGRGEGERLIEHYVRMDFATKNFKVTIPQVGRQKTRSVALSTDTDWIPENGSTTTPPAPTLVASGGDAAAEASADLATVEAYSSVVGIKVPFRIFDVTQDLIDDRGIVWIRHGKPDLKTMTVGGTAGEAWLYRRSGEPALVLFFAEADFDGSTGASVLVPTPAGGSPEAINQLCGGGVGLCDGLQGIAVTAGRGSNMNGSPNRTGASGIRVSPDQIRQQRDEGIAQIKRAVTTDAFARTFDAPLDPIAQVYGLDRAAGGSPRLVVAFALPGEKLSYSTPPEAGGRAVYPVRVRLLSIDQVTGARFELDSLRQFATATPLKEGQYLTGVAEMKVPAGRYTTTLVLTQDGGKGALARLAAVEAPANQGLRISDVVLGREGSGVTWNSGTTRVAMNPLNAYSKGMTAELYYQLSGLKSGQSYVTKLEFVPAADKEGKAKLSLSFPATADADRAEVVRSIGLENLEPGSYRLRVTVTGAGASSSATAWLVIAKK